MARRERTVTLTVGEEHLIAFPSLATAGYRWFVRVEGNQDSVEVSEHPTPALEDGPVGTSPDEVFAVVSRGPGRVRLRFEQRRPWEHDVPPVRIETVEVEVRAAP